MYDTIVTEDGRLAIVLRIPKSERTHYEIPEYREPIIIEYDEPEVDKEPSRVIIIDLDEEA